MKRSRAADRLPKVNRTSLEPTAADRAIHSVSSDREIIERTRSHPAAFAEIYDRHATTVHRFVSQRAGRDVADDVLSATFLAAFETRNRFDTERESALPWLLGIATRLLRRYRHLEIRQWQAVAASEPEGHADLGADERLEAQLAIKRLAVEIRRMPAGQRDVLLMFAWTDLGYQGIADALGTSVGTVRSRLNRARNRLRGACNFDAKEEPVGRFDAAALDTF